jgi:hypothetical protein
VQGVSQQARRKQTKMASSLANNRAKEQKNRAKEQKKHSQRAKKQSQRAKSSHPGTQLTAPPPVRTK